MALIFTSNELVEIGRRVQDARVAKRMTQEYVADEKTLGLFSFER